MNNNSEIKAFCSECKSLTTHQLSNFNKLAEKPVKEELPPGSSITKRVVYFLLSLGQISEFMSSTGGNGDYKCVKCGNNLRSPNM